MAAGAADAGGTGNGNRLERVRRALRRSCGSFEAGRRRWSAMTTSRSPRTTKRASTVFEAWGRLVYRWRWPVLAGCAVLLLLSVFALGSGGALTAGNPSSNSLEAFRAQRLIDQQVASGQPAGSSFLLIFGSRVLPATAPAFRAGVEAA